MSDRVDCVVIGAGVVGLAIGNELAQSGREVIVLERNAGIGEETSSRNSEVIHGGLYYPTASLKAKLCVAGKKLLYAYCEARQVPHRRCGKLIVATDEAQFDRLTELARQAEQNEVMDIERIDAGELSRREPSVRGVAALWSPSTGIVDSHALMLALVGDLEAHDGLIATHSEVCTVQVTEDSIRLEVRSGDDATELTARTVINAAGLSAVELARNCIGIETQDLPEAFLAKGNYFVYEGSNPFSTLVYPLPVAGGLGIHATLDLAGKLRFGPDVQWIESIDYSVDVARRDAFAKSISNYWPALDADALVPGYAGIRPKISGPGMPPADFRIDLSTGNRARQLIQLFGISRPD